MSATFVGVDVAKAEVVVACWPDGVRWTATNDARALRPRLRVCGRGRRQLLDMLTAERNRLAHAAAPIRRSLTDHIHWLERQLAEVDGDLDPTIERSRVWRAKENLLRTVPVVGPVVTRTLLADMPELGCLKRKQIAALIAVAPLARDNGTARGKRLLRGGRAPVRAALYVGALVATRDDPHLLSPLDRGGKPKKVALTACMRKLLTILNAIMRTNTTFR